MLNRAIVLLALTTAHGCFYNPKGSTGDLTGSTTESTTSSPIPTPTATTDDKPACGNGALEPGELCDDGNATPGDGCEVDCTKTPGELCGNGMVDEGEECDDGNHVAMDGCEYNCTETVIPASCGDGKTDVREECDDGNDDDTDDCLSSCKNAFCGDGQRHDGVEACDNGGDNSDTAYGGCTTQCQLGPRCGDEAVEAPEEECDDGTPDGDDLCNACKNVPYRYIFVTSDTFKGDFNKLPGADARCLIAASDLPAAEAAGWTAWLSDDETSASTRMDTTFVGWYVLPGPEQTLVARNWAGLTSGKLQNPINRDEAGDQVPANATAWTNTKADGKILSLDTASHCNIWDSNTGTGSVGSPNATDAMWANTGTVEDCSTMHHLYCVQN
ncbi:hypothetical protein OV090_40750 [Nannocystis sp. RBIL2]|uniref:DUF4215 domain-containing protein n=1 Tax=Nannocystis sp. RBIL2 TaxID=2996788 RepID=UPI00226D40BF|nr:DUF4215 domain-containing protein [Nannocystis sp. RBIL2]MCY1071143.1 hypothetical protein [Nannocystis sp. RBIL2]